jgi:signal transduction histidine kinase
MVGCLLLAVLAVRYFILDTIYYKGFEDLEKQTVEKSTNQVTNALSARLTALSTLCYDWAVWDDTYQFAQKYNQEYIDRNMQDETFISSKISVVCILNSYGDIVYSKAYDIIHSQEIVLPEDLHDILFADGLTQPRNLQNVTTGIMMLSGQPTLIVSRPILTSTAEGPSTGAFIMGRFLDSEVLSTLSETTHLSIDMLSTQSANQNLELNSFMKSQNNAGSVFVQAQSEDLISGYALVKDLSGNSAFMFKVDIPRDIYAQGKKMIVFMNILFVLFGIIFSIAFVVLIRIIVLSRLTALANSVSSIGSKGDMSSRVSITGKDELSKLADNINGMLESLEKSEIRQRSQNELISYIVANTPNAVLAINEFDNIVLANKAFTGIFGLDGQNIVGYKFDNLPALGNLIPEIRTFLGSSSLNSRIEMQYKYNGFNKTLIANFARMTEEKLFFIVMTDVSEERARQERLYLTDRLASVGEMASGIAHELNNPLTSVIGLSEMLVEENVPDHIKEDLSAINSEAKRAAVIVKNMLSFARKHSPQKQFTHINKIVEDVLKLRTHEHRVTNISVVCALAPDLPEIMVDFSQIQQVFINIILNAEQAMVVAHGKGTLIISTERAGNNVKVSFTDDGPGIETQYLHRIFDPFFTTKEIGKGTGLGLSISYGIVTAHNGLIYAKSEIGKGAAFVVELPIQTTTTEGE